MKTSIRRLLSLLLCLLAICAYAQAPETPAAPPAATPTPAQETVAPVQEIQFTGNTALTRAELLKATGITTGEPLTPKMLADAIANIQAAYTQRGYIADFVYYEIQGTEPPRTLVFHIREVHVSQIQIEGLTTTKEATVRKFIEIQPGQLYNQQAVREAVIRLTNLGIFEDVQVFLRQGAAPGEVILVFQVTEAKTQRIDFGGSYDPTGRLVFRVAYINSNFLGRAQQLAADVNIGTITGQLGGNVSLFNPAAPTPDRTLYMRAFSDIDFRFSTDLVNETDIGRYYERHTGFQSLWNHYIGTHRQLAYGFRYENVDAANFPLPFVEGNVPSPSGWLIVPSARWSQDNRVALVFPVSGTYTYALLEPGYSQPETGESGFIARLQADQRWAFPLRRITPEMLTSETAKPPNSFVTRITGGVSTGPLPFYEQFFLGGVDSLRGYRESRFWGKYYVLMNNEFRMPLSREIVSLAFVDVGDAWGSQYQLLPGVLTDFTQHKDFSPRVGYGVGVWYIAPTLGYIRLILGHGDVWRFGLAVGEPI